MSKDDQVFLKPTVFGGFQKKAVLSYIFELNETTQDAQQKLGEKVGELEKSNEALSEKLGETEQRLLAVQGELNAAKEQIEENAVKKAEADANLKKLEDEIERQNQTLAQKNSDISRYISVNCDLEKEIKDLGKKVQAFSEKRNHLEQTASKLSEMMASAKNDSARIITDAKATAARITENAGKQAENIIENAKATAKRHLNEQNGKIDAVYRQFDGFCAELLEYKETISNAAGAMSEKIDALHKSAVIAKSRVPEGAFSAEAPLASVEEIAIAETRPPKNGDDVLSQLGVQKDDSGFFRLAAEE